VTSSTKIVTSSSVDGWIFDSQIGLRFESAKSMKWTGRLLITLVFFYFLICSASVFVRVATHVADDQSAQCEDSLLLRPFLPANELHLRNCFLGMSANSLRFSANVD
jgi:hypothetical protein